MMGTQVMLRDYRAITPITAQMALQGLALQIGQT